MPTMLWISAILAFSLAGTAAGIAFVFAANICSISAIPGIAAGPPGTWIGLRFGISAHLQLLGLLGGADNVVNLVDELEGDVADEVGGRRGGGVLWVWG